MLAYFWWDLVDRSFKGDPKNIEWIRVKIASVKIILCCIETKLKDAGTDI